MKKNNRKSRAKRKKDSQSIRKSVLGICAVLILLVSVVSVGSINLHSKNKAYIEQEQELISQIEEEKERAEEIEELAEYVGTSEYVEQVAKDKLGLVYQNEIIFKTK